ncbi:hypothetical protein HELRODRAFT_175244 [Helobdella robusta]|uniref:Uncharacterized protein n=1 Tax=Helobdella robusta TaxID=6412 RepID=T1F923_HELRO|nr:hypothetical protein HELRODRAFT_175244 [Helobdella robusta]ESO00766.1 hypothetical protein HELRODRAFT_175244 [Helobdella robusta]
MLGQKSRLKKNQVLILFLLVTYDFISVCQFEYFNAPRSLKSYLNEIGSMRHRRKTVYPPNCSHPNHQTHYDDVAKNFCNILSKQNLSHKYKLLSENCKSKTLDLYKDFISKNVILSCTSQNIYTFWNNCSPHFVHQSLLKLKYNDELKKPNRMKKNRPDINDEYDQVYNDKVYDEFYDVKRQIDKRNVCYDKCCKPTMFNEKEESDKCQTFFKCSIYYTEEKCCPS